MSKNMESLGGFECGKTAVVKALDIEQAIKARIEETEAFLAAVDVRSDVLNSSLEETRSKNVMSDVQLLNEHGQEGLFTERDKRIFESVERFNDNKEFADWYCKGDKAGVTLLSKSHTVQLSYSGFEAILTCIMSISVARCKKVIQWSDSYCVGSLNKMHVSRIATLKRENNSVDGVFELISREYALGRCNDWVFDLDYKFCVKLYEEVKGVDHWDDAAEKDEMTVVTHDCKVLLEDCVDNRTGAFILFE